MCAHFFCCTSPAKLIFYFWAQLLRPCIYGKVCARFSVNFLFSPLSKTYYRTPLPLRISTKHMVRLRCRCFCVLHFFLFFLKCAWGPSAVKNSYFHFLQKKHSQWKPPWYVLFLCWLSHTVLTCFLVDDALAIISCDDLHLKFLVSRGWFRILFLLTSDRFDSVLGVQRLV